MQRSPAHLYWLYTYACLPDVVCSTDFLSVLGSAFGRSSVSVGLESLVIDGTLLPPPRSSPRCDVGGRMPWANVSPEMGGENCQGNSLEKQEWPAEVTSAGVMKARSQEDVSFRRHSGIGDRAYNHRICGHNDHN